MGRRKKAAKKIVQKKKQVVPTSFKCLFCNSELSVTCKLNFTTMVGQLKCRICDTSFETQINSLTDPIDVFSEWLDEAEELQEQENKKMADAASKGATGGIVGDGHDYIPGEDKVADYEGGVEMVEPAAKRQRTSSPDLDPLAGLEVAPATASGLQGEDNKQESAATASAATEDKDEEDEGTETWKDVASPMPGKAGAEPEPTQAQETNDVEATQAQPEATGGAVEDLF